MNLADGSDSSLAQRGAVPLIQHSAIGSFGQLANYNTRRTTANGQLTLEAFGRREMTVMGCPLKAAQPRAIQRTRPVVGSSGRRIEAGRPSIAMMVSAA